MELIQLNERQHKIIEIVKENEPITSEHIAATLNVTRATLRSDLAILTMTGILDARPKVGYFYTGISNVNLFGDSLRDKKVEDVMSIPSLARKDESVYDVIVTMFLSDVGSVVIIDENDLVCGIVSRKDMLKATIGGLDINKIPIGMIMTRTPNVVTASKDDTILMATKKIIEHEIDSLPVVEYCGEENKEMKLVGRLSKTSIAKLFLEIIDN
ncbi:MAG: helix-turn-helix transcriptional regulator [Clostridioides sp.]|nr:helix-turn-helix transcriptional regulator [Clostridioides sp.]